MDIYDALSLKVAEGRDEPDVWVRRIVLFRQIAPEPVEIREIKLTKGVNILWAEEPEDETLPAEITGHSAGKTSFCRLFRYILGETTFGTKKNMDLIQKAFPGGYVAAELFVHRQQWAVIRPIGQGRSSYMKKDASVEQLLGDRTKPASQEEYPRMLGLDALLDNLEAGAVLRTNRAIRWDHLLAWCTRDQETRFQNCYEWRSPRSESDWPSFRSSKSDPLFVMRVLLGLFLPDELKQEEKLAILMQRQEELEKALPALRQEPQFRVNLYEQELRTLLAALLPQTRGIESLPFRSQDLFLPSLDKLTDEAKVGIEKEIDVAEKERGEHEGHIDALGGKISHLQGGLKRLELLYGIDQSAKRELDDGSAKRDTQQTLLERHGEESCLLGGVVYQDCPIVQERQRVIRLSEAQDADSQRKGAAAKAEAQRGLDQQKKQLQERIAVLEGQRMVLRAKLGTFNTTLLAKRGSLRDLLACRSNLAEWTEKQNKPGIFTAIDDCHKDLKETEKRVEKLKARLNDLLTKHDENRKLISAIFSAVVRAVLPSGGYDGEVGLAERELCFEITRGPAMSGEAVETLAVLLADLCCLVYNSVSDRARLPGFLLHDSPREADLSLRLYERFVSLAASLQNHFGTAESCPFQYILTTTTPPPSQLRGDDWVKLHLNASVPELSLFRQNITLTNSELFN